MAFGRPTKYNPEILEKTKDYIKNFSKYGDIIPSIAGLACELELSRETLHTWSKEKGKEDFSDMLATLLSKQERTLLSGGLSGEMNSTISKLVLAKHNYSDKQETDITTGGEKIEVITRTIIDKA